MGHRLKSIGFAIATQVFSLSPLSSIPMHPPHRTLLLVLSTLLSSTLPVSAFANQAVYRVGDLVEVFWRDQWWSAKLERIQGDRYCITYQGYERSWDECVTSDRLRRTNTANPASYRVGDLVEVFWRDQWWSAKLERIQGNRYCITYEGDNRS